MKITRIKIRAVNIPLIKPYTVSGVGTLEETQSVVLELYTDQGLKGIGETDPELMFTGESQQTVVTVLREHLGPAVIGLNPLDLEALHARMNAVCLHNNFAKAAIDLACHDLWGKGLNVPLFQLFGGCVNPRIDVLWSLGSDAVEANVKDAVQRIEQGYTTLGLKVGTLSPDVDVNRVREVRKAVGDHVLIRCDANQAWTAGVAIRTIRRMEEYNICMFEQPVPGWDVQGLARVRAAVDTPVAVDEGFCSPRDALKLVKAEAADIFSIKTTKLGGLLPARKAAAIVEAAGHKIFINSMIEMGVSVQSGLNFAVSSPNLFACGQALNSVRRISDDILIDPVVYEGNQILAPFGRPGLGAELDEEKMRKYTIGEIDLS
jgi:L-alanine-DL-glutamate epimerase-like enolase superfamily enzyme